MHGDAAAGPCEVPVHRDAARSLPLADELSVVFARMSGLLLSEETVATAVGLLGSLVQETVPGAVGAGASIVDAAGRRSSGSTDPRWPRWAATVRDLGLLSVMSAPLVAGDRTLGALKVYGAEAGAFTVRDAQVLSLSAAQAALLVAHVTARERARRASDELRQAMAARDVVSTAKGVLMGRHGIGEETALAMLLSRSAGEGGTLRQAARAVVDSAVRRLR